MAWSPNFKRIFSLTGPASFCLPLRITVYSVLVGEHWWRMFIVYSWIGSMPFCSVVSWCPGEPAVHNKLMSFAWKLKFRSGCPGVSSGDLLVPSWRELVLVLILVARLFDKKMADLNNLQFVFQVSGSLGNSRFSCSSYARVWCLLVCPLELDVWRCRKPCGCLCPRLFWSESGWMVQILLVVALASIIA